MDKESYRGAMLAPKNARRSWIGSVSSGIVLMAKYMAKKAEHEKHWWWEDQWRRAEAKGSGGGCTNCTDPEARSG
jgi:hypothetical protein